VPCFAGTVIPLKCRLTSYVAGQGAIAVGIESRAIWLEDGAFFDPRFRQA
jgi:hypothetical protein